MTTKEMYAALVAIFVTIPSSAWGAAIVDGIGPDDDNGIPGIDRGDPTAVPPVPMDTCLRTLRFRTIQSALHAIQTGLIAETEVQVVTPGPLLARDTAVPPGVATDIRISRSLRLVGATTTRPLITGGVIGIVIETSGTVVIDSLQIAAASDRGVYAGAPATATSGPLLTLRRLQVHDHAGTGIHLARGTDATLDAVEVYANGRSGIAATSATRIDATATTVRDNAGPGIQVDGGTTTVLRAVGVRDNGSFGITVGPRTSLEVIDSVVTGNGSTGVLATASLGSPATVTVAGSLVEDNRSHGIAVGPAVALKVTNSPTGTSPTTVRGSSANGIFVHDSSQLDLAGARIEANGARGVSIINGSSGSVRRAQIADNREGGVNIRSCPAGVTIEASVIAGNRSPNIGGGIVVWDGAVATVKGSRILGNRAEGIGGGIAATSAAALTVGGRGATEANRIEDNETVHGVGGGVACHRTTTFALVGNLVRDNRALSADPSRPGAGGGLAIMAGCDAAEVVKNEISGNRAAMLGGGISIQDSNPTIGSATQADRNEVEGNACDGEGGGIGINDSDAKLLNNRVATNTADSGGGIFASVGRPTIGEASAYGGNQVTGNKALQRQPHGVPAESLGLGGGIYLVSTTDASIVGNTITANDGTGLHLTSSTGATIEKNWIGEDPSTGPSQNLGHGVAFSAASGNRIGPGNRIAYNLGAGVSIGVLPSTENTVTQSSLTENRDAGIFLWGFGNREIPPPKWCVTSPSLIEGKSSAPSGSIVEFFRDPDEEARDFLGKAIVGAAGTFSFTGSFPGNGQDVTAAVTDPAGNTSELAGARCLSFGLDSDNDDGPRLPEMTDEEERLRMTVPGKVLFWNDDYDGSPFPANAFRDFENAVIDGNADRDDDMALLRIEKMAAYPPGGRVVLSVSDRTRVRIFDESGQPRIGPFAPNSDSWVIPEADLTSRDVDLRIEGTQTTTTGPFTLTLESFDSSGTSIERQQALLSVATVDIDMDMNRSGVTDATVLDEVARLDLAGRPVWEWGPDGHGAIVLFNNDDDDRATGPGLDARDTILNGDPDGQDLAPVILRKLGVTMLPAGWKAVLRLDGAHFRVFSSRRAIPVPPTAPGVSVLPAVGDHEVPDLLTRDLEYGVEGSRYPDVGFDGSGRLSLTLEDAAGNRAGGQDLAHDEVVFRTAPFLLADHTENAQLVYYRAASTTMDAGFRGALGVTNVHPVPLGDQWEQDEFEIGYSTTPALFQTNVVAADLPRGAGAGSLDRYLDTNKRGPDYADLDLGAFGGAPVGGGPIKLPAGFGGNLELSPPVRPAARDYPLGRIVTSTQLPARLLDFLNAQEVQGPAVQVDATWLGVGHVDEMLGFLPWGTGFKLVVADPGLALALLDAMPAEAPFFHEGQWTSGRVTASVSLPPRVVITDATKSWAPGQWVGGVVRITDCAGAGAPAPDLAADRLARVVASDATSITAESWTGLALLAELAPPAVGCSYTLVERSKEWDLGGLPMPALVTAGELRSEQDAGWPWTSTPPVVPPTHPLAGRVAYSDGRYLRSKNTWIRDLLWVGPGSVVETLKRELGLSPADIIAVPAYYTGRWSGPPPAIGTPSPPGRVVEEAEAIVPGAANFQVFGTNLFVADQFAPPSWESDLQARLVASAGSGVFPLRLTWIDDWDVYHRLSGEVHCGSNVEKKPPAQERWWEVQP